MCNRLLVLDEMDQLDSKSQEVLYTIFEWPYLPKSRVCLIGKIVITNLWYYGLISNKKSLKHTPAFIAPVDVFWIILNVC